MMQLFFQKHTVMGRLPLLDRMYEDHLSALCGRDAGITLASLPAETYDVELPERFVRFGAVESLFAGFFGLQARRAEEAGYDAYIIGTSQDPGLELARAITSIPVVGYGEAAAAAASLVADRFTFVGFIPELEEAIRRNMEAYGLGGRVVPFAHVEGGAEVMARALRGDPERFLEEFRAAARRAIRDGARALIPGEGLPNEVLWAQGVRDVDGVPVVDADGAAVLAALHRVGLQREGVLPPPAPAGYFRARPPEEMLEHLVRLYRPAVMVGLPPLPPPGSAAALGRT